MTIIKKIIANISIRKKIFSVRCANISFIYLASEEIPIINFFSRLSSIRISRMGDIL